MSIRQKLSTTSMINEEGVKVQLVSKTIEDATFELKLNAETDTIELTITENTPGVYVVFNYYKKYTLQELQEKYQALKAAKDCKKIKEFLNNAYKRGILELNFVNVQTKDQLELKIECEVLLEKQTFIFVLDRRINEMDHHLMLRELFKANKKLLKRIKELPN